MVPSTLIIDSDRFANEQNEILCIDTVNSFVIVIIYIFAISRTVHLPQITVEKWSNQSIPENYYKMETTNM